jgi:hypothetical protein
VILVYTQLLKIYPVQLKQFFEINSTEFDNLDIESNEDLSKEKYLVAPIR